MKMCRGCLSSDTRLDILSNKKVRNVYSFIYNRNMPSKSKIYLCYKCINMIRNILEFQEMCLSADEILREYNKLSKKDHKSNINIQSKLQRVYKSLTKSNELNIDVCCVQDNSLCKSEEFDLKSNERFVEDPVDYPRVEVFSNYLHRIDQKDQKHIPEQSACLQNGYIKFETLDDDCHQKADSPLEPDAEDFPEPDDQTINEDSYDVIRGDDLKQDELHPQSRTNSDCKDINTKELQDNAQSDKSITKGDGGLSKEDKYVCNICSKSFDTPTKLKRHQLIHDESRRHVCVECHKTYKRRDLLKAHMSVHTGVFPFVCDVCGRGFALNNTLRNHRLTHGGPKKFECGYCNKKFLRKLGVKNHIKIHTGEKNYVCDICGRAFNIERNLTAHRRAHLGIKPYSCNVCGKCFTESGALKIHRRSHTGERPYACKICEKTFTCTAAVRVHNKSHSDDKPYKCDVCSYSAKRVFHLKRHKLTHFKNSKGKLVE